MTQLTFGDADFSNKGKKTRKERFLGEMEQIVPWQALQRLIVPFYPEAGNAARVKLVVARLLSPNETNSPALQ